MPTPPAKRASNYDFGRRAIVHEFARRVRLIKLRVVAVPRNQASEY